MSLRIKTKIQAPNIEQTESQNPVMTQKIFQNSFSWVLEQNGEWEFQFGLSQTWILSVGTGGSIYYKNDSLSGVVYENQSFSWSFSGTLFLKWLSGMSSVEMSFSWSEGIEFPYNYYTKTQKFWSNEVEIWRGKISE